MTPEQSNLAKLLSNMHMPSSGAATRTQPIPLLQQQNAPAAFLPVTSAAHPRMPTMHLQPPCFHQPTAMGTMPGLSEAEEGMDSQTGQPTSQPALLTPKFLAAGQQVRGTLTFTSRISWVVPISVHVLLASSTLQGARCVPVQSSWCMHCSGEAGLHVRRLCACTHW
jgi:hypothetical protein